MIRISAFADEISQDPVEQVDVLSRHGIGFIEFRAIHGTNVPNSVGGFVRDLGGVGHDEGDRITDMARTVLRQSRARRHNQRCDGRHTRHRPELGQVGCNINAMDAGQRG